MPFLLDSDLSAARNLHVSFAALWYFDLRAIVPVDSYIDIRYILMILNLSGQEKLRRLSTMASIVVIPVSCLLNCMLKPDACSIRLTQRLILHFYASRLATDWKSFGVICPGSGVFASITSGGLSFAGKVKMRWMLR